MIGYGGGQQIYPYQQTRPLFTKREMKIDPRKTRTIFFTFVIISAVISVGITGTMYFGVKTGIITTNARLNIAIAQSSTSAHYSSNYYMDIYVDGNLAKYVSVSVYPQYSYDYGYRIANKVDIEVRANMEHEFCVKYAGTNLSSESVKKYITYLGSNEIALNLPQPTATVSVYGHNSGNGAGNVRLVISPSTSYSYGETYYFYVNANSNYSSQTYTVLGQRTYYLTIYSDYTSSSYLAMTQKYIKIGENAKVEMNIHLD